MRDDEHVTDAEFEIVRGDPPPPPKRSWWFRPAFHIRWRVGDEVQFVFWRGWQIAGAAITLLWLAGYTFSVWWRAHH